MRFKAELLDRPFAPAPIVTRESIRVGMRVSGEVQQASLVRGFHCPTLKAIDVNRAGEVVGDHGVETGALDKLADPIRSNVAGAERRSAGVALCRGDCANRSSSH